MYRRSLLSLTGALASATLLPGRLLASGRQQWQNWSGNQLAAPAAIHYPDSVAALQDILSTTPGSVRCFGGSHSFSALVPSDDTLISLEAMSGLQHSDSATGISRFGAGTRLAMASQQAWQQGLSFTNEPDINLQSLAGAIATGTHGTGRQLPCLSAQVTELDLLTADGTLHSLSAADGDLFRAAQCSLGALGIVTAVSFQQQPAYRLRETTRAMNLDEAFEMIDSEKDNYRNIEMFVFPHGRTAMVKTVELTDDEEDIFPPSNSNEMLEMMCEGTRHAAWLQTPIQKLLKYFVGDEIKQGPSWRVYGNIRTVRFNEMEYTVPADDGLDTLKAVTDIIDDQDINVMFPLEYRYSAADDTMIGMFSQRPGASISVHQYFKQDYQPLFNAVEPALIAAQGRPHWGKLHTLSASQLQKVYPEFERFCALRRELDPQGRFLNAHLKKILGES